MKRRALVLTVLGLGLLGPAAFAGNFGDKFAQDSARGDYAVVTLGKNIGHPDAIYMVTQARPKQSVNGNWSLTCTKGSGVGSKSGHFRGQSTFVERMNLPMSNPDGCGVAAQGQLNDSGKVTVKLFVRR
jgi:hypothetical protein